MHIYATDRRTGRKSSRGKLGRRGKMRRRLSAETLERRNLLATITVTSLDDTVVDDGQVTLREAILAANTDSSVDGSTPGSGPDEISFDSSLSGAITLSGNRLEISDDLTISGPGAGVLGVDGDSSSQLFFTSGTIDVEISGLTLFGGVGARGGAIENADANLTISDSVITQNSASESGGGIYNDSGAVTVVDSVIGGASLNDGNASLGGGGGIFNNSGALALSGTTISNNSSIATGGGIQNQSGTLSIQDSAAYANRTQDDEGGGLWNGGTATITQTTISGNTAGGSGGGLYNHTGTLSVIQSTIVDNLGDHDGDGGSGGGVATRDDASASTHLFNTIVAGNTSDVTASDIGGKALAAGSANNLIADPASAGGLSEGTDGNLVGDGSGSLLPRSSIVDDLAANHAVGPRTHALVSGSRAIDAGDSALATTPGDDGVPGTSDNGEVALEGDQRGAPFDRIDGSSVDIGAYEQQVYDSLSFVVTSTSDDLDFGSDVSLREALIAADDNPGADTISFGGSIFTDSTPDTITLARQIAIASEVTIDGPGAELLSISGGDAVRIFRIDGDAVINNVTLTEGNGAIANQGTLLIADSVISDSEVTTGFRSGGGIDNSGTLTILRSTISGNSATGFGGAILNRDQLTIVSSTISGNNAGVGTIFNDGSGAVDLIGSTISGNTAEVGSGIYNNNGTVTIWNSTIVANQTVGNEPGGAVFTRDVAANTLEMFNTIVAGNAFDDVDGKDPEDNSANNVIGTELGGISLDRIVDPVLADNGGPTLTHALVAGSPALDAGDSALLPPDTFDLDGNQDTSEALPHDQRGSARIFDQLQIADLVDALDVGAFELDVQVAADPQIVVSPTGPGGASDPADLPSGPQPTSWVQQRSDVRVIVINFGSAISAPTANDLVLTNLGVNAPVDPDTVVALDNSQLSLSQDGRELTISFDANELEDGVYQIELLSSITGGDSFTITGDATNRLFVLTGDWNGSGGVNIQDFATFAYWFGNSLPTAPDYVDANDTGGINIQDFSAFAANFGQGVTFPGASSLATGGGEGELVALMNTLTNRKDTNGDGQVSAIDALQIINAVNNGEDGPTSGFATNDVNQNGIVSMADAIVVINELNRESSGPVMVQAIESSDAVGEAEEIDLLSDADLLDTSAAELVGNGAMSESDVDVAISEIGSSDAVTAGESEEVEDAIDLLTCGVK